MHCITFMAANVGSRECIGMSPSQLGMGLDWRRASGPFSNFREFGRGGGGGRGSWRVNLLN